MLVLILHKINSQSFSKFLWIHSFTTFICWHEIDKWGPYHFYIGLCDSRYIKIMLISSDEIYLYLFLNCVNCSKQYCLKISFDNFLLWWTVETMSKMVVVTTIKYSFSRVLLASIFLITLRIYKGKNWQTREILKVLIHLNSSLFWFMPIFSYVFFN